MISGLHHSPSSAPVTPLSPPAVFHSCFALYLIFLRFGVRITTCKEVKSGWKIER